MVHDGALMSGILSGFPFMYLLLKQQCVCLPFIIIIIMGNGFCYTLFFLNPFSIRKGWSLPWLMRVCKLIRGFPSFFLMIYWDFFGFFSVLKLGNNFCIQFQINTNFFNLKFFNNFNFLLEKIHRLLAPLDQGS
jgi:hypothetical protein